MLRPFAKYPYQLNLHVLNSLPAVSGYNQQGWGSRSSKDGCRSRIEVVETGRRGEAVQISTSRCHHRRASTSRSAACQGIIAIADRPLLKLSRASSAMQSCIWPLVVAGLLPQYVAAQTMYRALHSKWYCNQTCQATLAPPSQVLRRCQW